MKHLYQRVFAELRLSLMMMMLFSISNVYANYGVEPDNTLQTTRTDSCIITTLITGFDITCFGNADGFAAVSAVGGDGEYHYQWSDPNQQSSSIAVGLTPGTYTVTVTDTTATCFAIDTIEITQPDSIDVMYMTNSSTCNGSCDGSVSFLASGGSGVLTVSFMGSATPVSGITTFNSLCAGSHQFTVTDANNCSKTIDFVIDEPDSVQAILITEDATCFGLNNGFASLEIIGGTPPLYYRIGGPGNPIMLYTGMISANTLPPGNYPLAVGDANMCIQTLTVSIGQPTPIMVSVDVSTNYNGSDVSCFDASDGAALATATGGNPPYTYKWDANAGSQSTALATGLSAGTYSVIVTDSNGCTMPATVTLEDPDELIAAVADSTIDCFNDNDGILMATVSGGTPEYFYQWDSASGLQNGQFAIGLSAGIYSVTITDVNGCSTTASGAILGPDSIEVSVSGTAAGCQSTCNGTAIAIATGGTGITTYLWSNGETTQALSGLCAGTYFVTITDQLGCEGIGSIVIEEHALPTVSVGPFNDVCDSTKSFVLTSGLPAGGLYSGAGVVNGMFDPASVGPGTYDIIYQYSDSNGCSASDTATIAVFGFPILSAFSADPSCANGDDGSIDLSITNGTPPYSIIWSNDSVTEDLSGLTAGAYTAIVTGAGNCSDTITVVLTNPLVLAISATKMDVLCEGDSTGSIDITAMGGTPPYAYMWSNGAMTEDLSALAAGSYTITVTDENGCMASATITINETPAIALSATTVDVLCNGDSTGSIDLTVSGGTTPYSFSWSNGDTTEDLSGLPAGSYIGTVTDANGCTASATVVINEPTAIALSATTVDVLCNGDSTGSIDLTVSGGTAPYSFAWSNGDTIEDLSGLPQGSYTGTVTDANGCSASATVVINEPTAIALSATTVDVLCNGDSTGSIDLTVSGGTTPYSFSWSNGDTTEDLSGLPAGSYIGTLTDANGCSASATVAINEPTAIALSATTVDVLCNGDSTGSIDLTVSGGTAPYSFSWSNGDTTEDLNALPAGSYTGTVTDANGCSASATVAISEPTAIALSATTVDVLCNGDSTGSIDLTVSGGTTPYSFSWSNGDTTEDLSSLPAGSYTGTVTDANGCTASATVAINEPTAIALSATTVDVLCNGDSTGSIDLTVSGGTAPYSFSWSNGDTTEDLSGLPAGSYTGTVTDANGCTSSATATIIEPTAIALSATTVDVLCNGDSTGSIDLTVSGGTAPYSFAWSNGDTTEDLNSLPAGSYTGTVTDANGCSASATVVINEPTAIALSATTVDVLCNGDSTGSIDLTVSGGTTPYSFSWSNGDTIEDLSGLPQGSYTGTVTDANGCSESATVAINEPTAIALSATTVDVLCNGDSTGSIDLTVSGGTAPYSFAWSNGDTTEDLSGLPAGSYTGTVTDANGCSESATVVINEPTAIALSATTVDVLCNGDSTGSIDLTVSGGTTPYSFSWSNGDTIEDLSGLPQGSYTGTVTDANGCSASATVAINEPTAIALSATTVDVLCNGDSTGSIDLTVSGGTTPYSFSWSNGDTIEDLSGLPQGSYTGTVTDANGCSASATVVINEPTAIALSATTVDVLCNGDSTGSIDLTVSGGTAPYSFSWSNGDTTEDLSGLPAGSYTGTVTDANGCSASATVVINEPTAIALSATTVDVLCNGDSTGSIDLTVSGGTTPYSFSWSNGDTIEDLSGLPQGSYTGTVTDANGCSASATVVINEPTAIALSATTVDVLCNGDSTGSIDLTVSGGTTPYSFSWSNGDTTEDLSGLPADSYTGTVTDANGCSASATVVINEPIAIALSATTVDILCNGDSTGSIDLTVSGGTTPYSFSWSNGDMTEDLSGLPAGSYIGTVTDANGCSASATVVINEPTAIALSVTTVDVLCNGDSTGSIDLIVSGGTAPYSFSWSNGDTTEDLSGLPQGSYTGTVTDANGCTSSATATIIEPIAIALSATTVDVLCNGDSTGSIDLTVSGGTTPYSFSWSNGDTTEDLSSLPAGSYTGTVTDANGCSASATVVINEPTAIALSATTVDVLCNGDSTGSIDLTVSGGTAPYSFSWSNGDTTEDLSGLPAGSYIGTVTDANGCTASATVAITEPTAIALSATTVDVLCNGDSTGSIDLTVSGGTTPYSFSWSNGDTTEDLSGLPAGSYIGTVTDANGCTASATVAISEPTAIALSATTVDVLCNGDSTGSIDLTVSGGTTPYSFSWSNGDTTEDLNGLPAGSYTGTVTDANGCSASATVVINEPTAIALSATTVDVLCNGDSTGSIDLTVSGGTAPYSFSWSNGDTTEDLNGLPAGSYTGTVTDANGCSASATVVINEPTAIALSATTVDVLCNGDSTGSIDLTVSGGTTPYSFSWSNGDTTEDLSGLPAGSYTGTVTDANGCSASATVAINEPTAIALSATTVDVLCNGDSTGSIDLTVSGGTTPYSFAWSNGDTTEDLSGLPAGSYTGTVTDANGCTASATVVINEPTAIALSATTVDVLCNGDSTGSIDLTVSGGTAPYSFSWSNGDTTEDLSGLPAGSYTGTVTDANGCTASATVAINEPTAIALSATTVDVFCNGDSTGSIDLTVSGGTAPYSFSWSNGDTTEDLSGLPAGSYTGTVTDANGCTSSATATIIEPTAIALSATTVDVLCNGDSTGSIDLTVSGGTAPYSFSWSNGDTTEDLSGLPAGSYTGTVTDANGCSASATVAINEPTAIALSATTVDVLCNGDSTGSIDLTVSGGTTPYSFSWSNGDTTEDLNSLPAGSYTGTVTDANGCSASATVAINEPTAIALSATTVDVLCNGDSTGSIDLTVSGGTTPYSFSWSNGDTTEDLSSLPAGSYTGTVTDANGCSASATVAINEPTAIALSATTVDVLCNGDSTGSIDLTVSGGTTPYSFSWSNGDTTEDLSGLPAGSYTGTVTDANGCSANATVVINEPTAIALSATRVDVLCNGDSTGSIDLTVSGGTAPYSFSWSNGDTTEDLSGLPAGSYTGTVTDANGCSASATVVINEPTAIALSATTVDILCNGDSTGSNDLTVSGGTTPYSFSWSNGDTTEDLSGLPAGSYTGTVTDANGCSASATVVINEPTAIALSATRVDVLCNGDSTGSIDLTVSGGTAPYSFSWSNGDTTEDLSGLPAGSYTGTVTDANGCIASASATIAEPTAIALSATTVDVLCNGDSTGSIDLTVSGGTTPYSFSWSNGDTTEDLSGLPQGSYTGTVTDASGCSVGATVVINEPTAIALSATTVDVLCNGDSTGSIDLTVSGGAAPYSFSWSNGDTTEDLSGLPAGSYTGTVTDANGCSASATVAINEPTAIALSATTVDVLCNGDSTGSIDLTVSGGTTPYSFSWSNGDTTEDLSSLPAGSYTGTVTDANGCSASATVVINEPTAIALSPTTVDVLCNGDSTGSIDLTLSGGTTPYSFSWSNGDTTEDLSSLPAGSYTGTVTDANGCSASATVVINEPTAIALSATTVDVLCNGDSTGSIDLTVSGGTTPYSFSWSNGAVTEDISNLIAGLYSVTVTDANGCIAMQSENIFEPTPLQLFTFSTDVTCSGANDGTASAVGEGGTPPYSFLWSNGSTIQDLTNLNSGTYSVTMTDANGCTISSSATVNEPAAIVVNVTTMASSCSSGCIGSALATASGGNAPYTYMWDDPMNQTTQTATGLCAGTYMVTVTDADGCFSVSTVEIVNTPDLIISMCPDQNIPIYGLPGTGTVCACDGKIVQMSVVYDGPAGATISVGPNSGGSNPTIYTNVQPGDTLTVNLGDIGSNWYWEVNGIVDATIHTSCSDDILNNINSTKSDFGSLGNYPNPDQNNNDGTFLVVGHVDDKMNVCGTTDNIPVQAVCACDGKIIEMTVIYDGPVGAFVTVGPNSSGNNPTSWMNVQPGDTLTASLGDIGNDWYWAVNGTVDANIHASCSDDILNNINASKSDFGSLGSYPNPEQNNNDGTFLVIGHVDDNANVCGVGTVPPSIQPCECSGGVTQLNVIYDGPSGATVSVGPNSSGSNPTIFSNVNPGDTLVANLGSVGSNWYWSVNGVVDAEMHTSCSDDLLFNINSGSSDFGSLGSYPNPDQNNNDGTFLVIGQRDKDNNICGYFDLNSICPEVTVSFEVMGGTPPFTFQWSNGSMDSILMDNICETTTYTVTVTDANGCFVVGTHTATVIDISCDDNKVTMCHDPGTSGAHTHCIDIKDIQKKLDEGYALGDCFTDFSSTGCGPTPPVPPVPCDCDGKIIQMTTIYDGPAGATVSVGPNSSGNNPTVFMNVQPGDTLTASLGDIGNDWYWAVNGVVDGNIHASCSDDVLGNVNSTKSDFGSLGNYPNPAQGNNNGTFLLAGFADNSGNLCGVGTLPPAPCDCDGKIVQMSTIYDGPAGATVSVGPNSGGNNPTVFMNVQPGDTLTASLGDIGNDWYWAVNGVVDGNIHASCSDDVLGNVNSTKSDFGSLGNYPNPAQGNNNGTFLLAGFVDNSGNLCGVGTNPPAPPVPCACDGKIIQMTTIYDGPAGATVSVGPNSSGNNPTVFMNVQPGDTLTASLGDIGNDWYWAVNGVVDGNIHASCSDDVLDNVNSTKSDFGSLGNYPNPAQGNNNGTFLLAGFADNSGNLCGVGTLPPPPCDCDGKIVEMIVVYDGPNGANITVGPNSSGSNPTNFTNVQVGDTLVANLGNIGNDWYWAVNGTVDANLHASCSDDILGNVNASKSDFGSLGSYPNPDQNSNDGTFLVIGHTDENGNQCTIGQAIPKQSDRSDRTFEYGKAGMLLIAYPNPFDHLTTIKIALPTDNKISLKVFDIAGKELVTLYDGDVTSGQVYLFNFDGRGLTSGMYYYRLITNDGSVYTEKLMLSR